MKSDKKVIILNRIINFKLNSIQFLLIVCILLILSMIGPYIEFSTFVYPENEYQMIEETIKNVNTLEDAIKSPYFDSIDKIDNKVIISYKADSAIKIKQTADYNFKNTTIERNYRNSKDYLDKLLLVGIFTSFFILSLSAWLIYTIFMPIIQFFAKKMLKKIESANIIQNEMGYSHE